MSERVVSWSRKDRIVTIGIDNGKANAISPAVLAGINEALDSVDAAGDDVGAVILHGKPGVLSGGFELQIMRAGGRDRFDLVADGGDLCARLYGSAVPIVAACTGHAVAAGALILLGSHFRVGARGDFKIGLNETRLGMVLPDWALHLARERLSVRHLQQATIEARMYDPDAAAEAGFLDRIVEAEAVLEAAREEAERLASLPAQAYAANAKKIRAAAAARVRDAAAADWRRRLRSSAHA
jgi:enoyl-CoA hydratase